MGGPYIIPASCMPDALVHPSAGRAYQTTLQARLQSRHKGLGKRVCRQQRGLLLRLCGCCRPQAEPAAAVPQLPTPPGLSKQDVAVVEGKQAPAGGY